MLQMQGLTLGQLIEICDQATPEVQEWMLDNSKEWVKEKPLHISTEVYNSWRYNEGSH